MGSMKKDADASHNAKKAAMGLTTGLPVKRDKSEKISDTPLGEGSQQSWQLSPKTPVNRKKGGRVSVPGAKGKMRLDHRGPKSKIGKSPLSSAAKVSNVDGGDMNVPLSDPGNFKKGGAVKRAIGGGMGGGSDDKKQEAVPAQPAPKVQSNTDAILRNAGFKKGGKVSSGSRVTAEKAAGAKSTKGMDASSKVSKSDRTYFDKMPKSGFKMPDDPKKPQNGIFKDGGKVCRADGGVVMGGPDMDPGTNAPVQSNASKKIGKKGATVVNVIIPPASPSPMPIPVPIPPGGGPGAGGPGAPPPAGMAAMGGAGGPGGPPAPMPPMPPPGGGGGPPMMRKAGGRIDPTPDMDFGAGGGKGRLQKVRRYGDNADDGPG